MNPEQLIDSDYWLPDEDMQLYEIAVKNGAVLKAKLAGSKIVPEDLDQYDLLALHTNEFYEHWGDWRLKDIPFIRNQFPWMLDNDDGA